MCNPFLIEQLSLFNFFFTLCFFTEMSSGMPPKTRDLLANVGIINEHANNPGNPSSN